MVNKIAELRNERIDTTKRMFNLDEMIYHCVARRNGGMLIYEQPMKLIDIKNIGVVKNNENIINFDDGKEEYKFNISKSTLYKRFVPKNIAHDFDVKIFNNPFKELENLLIDIKNIIYSPIREQEHIFLPLYSYKKITDEKFVYTKSGLNQWNAGGRNRDIGEVYIPIPAWIHQSYPDFFPERDIKFNLILPNKKILKVKLCQENSKALMSDPNKDLGQWLLRDILNLKDGELLTYRKLEQIGVDSVVLYKISEKEFQIDFTKIGTYDDFKDNLTVDDSDS